MMSNICDKYLILRSFCASKLVNTLTRQPELCEEAEFGSLKYDPATKYSFG